MHGFGEVNRAAARGLQDLLATTETIGDDEGILIRLAHGGEQDALPNRLRNGKLLFLESEWAGHATATRIGRMQIRAYPAEERLFIVHLQDGFVVAMAVEKNLASEPRLKAGRKSLK